MPLVLALALALFFAPALRHNWMLSPTGLLFDSPAFAGARQPPGSTNSLLFDQVYQFIPWRRLAYDALRAGRIPAWNPYSLSGAPFIATMQSAVFYPINLITTLVPFDRTFVISAILRLWIAGFATYLLARRYQLARTSSLVAAISFMLSGFLIAWLGHPHTNVAVWLPALILLAEQLIDPDRRWRRAPSIALLALIIGIQFTGGHIETSVDILLATGAYSVVRCWQVARRDAWPILRIGTSVLALALAVILGAGLAGIQLVPFLEWIPLSAEYGNRAAGGFQLLDTTFTKTMLSLPLLLFPNIYGNPAWDRPYVSGLSWTNYNEMVLYLGTLPLAFAALAVVTRWRANPFVRAWGMIGALALGMALRLPLFDWVNQMPGLDLTYPGRLRLVVLFSLCLLAGFGAEALFAKWPEPRRAEDRYWVIICGAIGLCSLSLIVRRDAPLPFTARHFQDTRVALYSPLIMAALGLILLPLVRASRSNARFVSARCLIVLLVLGELFYYGWGYNPALPAADFYPEPSAFAAIQRDDPTGIDRFIAIKKSLIPDAQVMFHQYDLRGLDFPTKWYTDYLDALPDRLPWISYGVILASADSPLIRVLNIRYVISDNATDVAGKPYISRVDQAGQVFIGTVTAVQPRSFMVYDEISVPDDRAAQQLLRSRPDLVRDTVLIPESQQPRALSDQNPPGAATAGQINPLAYRADQSSWHVSTARAGYLFSSDSYYPGWSVYVDGKPVKLYRADIAFRAVYVPAGDHTVEFRYEPESFKLGRALSLASLAIILILLVPVSLFRRKHVLVQ